MIKPYSLTVLLAVVMFSSDLFAHFIGPTSMAENEGVVRFAVIIGDPPFGEDIGITEGVAKLINPSNSPVIWDAMSVQPGETCTRPTGCTIEISTRDGYWEDGRENARSGVDFILEGPTVFRWNQGENHVQYFTVKLLDNENSIEFMAGTVAAAMFSLDSVDGENPFNTFGKSTSIWDDEAFQSEQEAENSVENETVVLTSAATQVAESIRDACAESELDVGGFQRDCNQLVSLESSSSNEVNLALNEIAPDQMHTSVAISQQSGLSQISNIGSRVNAIRSNRRTTLSGLNINVGGISLSLAQLYAGGGAGDDSSILNNKLGVFISGDLSFGKRDSTTNEEGYDFSSNGLTAGADYQLNDKLVLGAALGISKSDNEFDTGGDLSSDGLFTTLFGSYYLDDKYYMDAGLTLGKNEFSQSRHVKYTLTGNDPVDQIFYSKFDSSELSWFLNAGMNYQRDNGVFLTPKVRLQLVQTDIDQISENRASNPDAAGSGWAVIIDKQNLTSISSEIGLKASKSYSKDYGVLTPYGALGWLHDFDASKSEVSGYFSADPTKTKFTFQSDSRDSNTLRLNAGASLMLSANKSLFADYSTLLGRSHFSSHHISAGFRWGL